MHQFKHHEHLYSAQAPPTSTKCTSQTGTSSSVILTRVQRLSAGNLITIKISKLNQYDNYNKYQLNNEINSLISINPYSQMLENSLDLPIFDVRPSQLLRSKRLSCAIRDRWFESAGTDQRYLLPLIKTSLLTSQSMCNLFHANSS